MSRSRLALTLLCVVVASTASTRVAADTVQYAIIIGNNSPAPGDSSLQPLKYADDDAVRYYQMAERWGAQSTLLTVLDRDTQRRYPEVAIEARPPTRENLDNALAAVALKVARERERGHEAVFYFIFAGHGSVSVGTSHLALVDDRITQKVLYEEIVERVPAESIHLIIDACHASGVVGSRGMFDQETTARVEPVAPEEVAGLSKLKQYPHVGVLLAATLGEEAHEWSRIESGVFSHEVISGLSGPADVNRDGNIEYSEIHAFVASANRDLKNRSVVPRVIAFPPERDHHLPLVKLSQQRGVAWLEGDATKLGHFYVERSSGERYLDANIASSVPVRFTIPSEEVVFVHTKTAEARVEAGEGQIIRIAALSFRSKEVVERGAVEAEYHARLFASPFNEVYYQGFVDRAEGTSVSFDNAALLYDVPAPPKRKKVAIGLFATSGAAVVSTAIAGGLMGKAKRDFDSTDIQNEAEDARRRYENARTATIVSGTVAVLTAIGGAIAWPKKKPAKFKVEVDPRRRHYAVEAGFSF